ncbi:MAG: transketolase C-terminal domain-containing protein [Candidatus Bathyarchaeia archaeon]|nr:pyruvate ferredoxin oxidoreductase [Candidatus Bathyarchaeota archaeon]
MEKMKVVGLSGDQIAAYAAKQCRVDVVSAYPITPQTIIVEEYSNYVANGEVDTEFICVESEHSAMSACIGASLTGARVFTATSSQGLALMHEMLYIASGLRCPIVMCVVNRALSAPINIHCDHSDMMGSRDCGWIQVFAENAQEVYDWVIQAFKIAEDREVLLPMAVNLDGFTISHALEDIRVLEDGAVDEFLPEREAVYRLDPDNPILVGPLVLPDYYFEFKVQQEEAMRKAAEKIGEVTREYYEYSSRKYAPIDPFNVEGANTALIAMGSTAGMLRTVARQLEREGKRVAVIKLWLYRPFPGDELIKLVEDMESLIVLDRTLSFGAPVGPLCSDVIAALYNAGRCDIRVANAVYGLGGRDLTPAEVEELSMKALKMAETKMVDKRMEFIGVRE